MFSASPVAADGKVYFVSENGETIVMQAGRHTDGPGAQRPRRTRDSPHRRFRTAQIFIRTDGHRLVASAIGQSDR